MTSAVLRQLVRDFAQARMLRNPARIASFLDDDVTWSIFGPVDLIPFCGQRHGKQAVVDAIVRLAPALLTVTKLEFEDLLIDGDRAASFYRVTAVQTCTERIMSYQRAEFIRFRDNKIMSYRAIMDSFDVAEQVLGHQIDVSMPCSKRVMSVN